MPKKDHPRKYRTVSEMLREAVGSEEAMSADEFDQHIAERKLVKELAIMRSMRNMSQQDLAEQIAKSQSWVSKFESSRDDELSIGDLRLYMGAIGLEFRAGAVKQGATVVDEVKQLAFSIKRRLHTLAELAKEDDGMVEHIASFFAETFCNLNRFLSEAAAKLPKGRQKKTCISVSFELELLEELEEGEAEDSPLRTNCRDRASTQTLCN